jgi:branched-chain amino acid transport system substrate-binding protein
MNKTMRHLWAVALAFVLAAPAARAAIPCPIEFGSVRPESGASAYSGHSFANGVAMALDQIAEKGGIAGCKVNIIAYDSQSQPGTAATLARRLVFSDHVPFVLGSSMSVESLAMLEVTETAQVPLYVASAASAKITNQGFKWVWRQSVVDVIAARALTKFVANELGWKKVAVAYENSDYGRPTWQNVIRPSLEQLGVSVTTAEAITSGDSDFSSQLLRMRDSGAQGIIYWGYLKEASILLQENQQLKINLSIAGGTGIVYPSFVKLLSPETQDATTLYGVSQFVPSTDDPQQKAWVDAYRSRFGIEPDVTSLDAYDMMFVLKKAIEAAGSMDPDKLQAALGRVHYTGVGGSISFDDTGQARRAVEIVKLTAKSGPGFSVVKVIPAD